jgi:hypothetical protein
VCTKFNLRVWSYVIILILTRNTHGTPAEHRLFRRHSQFSWLGHLFPKRQCVCQQTRQTTSRTTGQPLFDSWRGQIFFSLPAQTSSATHPTSPFIVRNSLAWRRQAFCVRTSVFLSLHHFSETPQHEFLYPSATLYNHSNRYHVK